MVILISRLRITEEKIEAFRQYLREFLAASRAEDACIRFTVSEDIEQTNYFLFTAIWRDEAGLEQHENSAHLAQFKQAIGAWIIEVEKSQVYSVSAARDL